jgi:hypothetical protein
MQNQPWNRLPGESTKAFSAFSAYRDLGSGRSIVEAYRHQRGTKGATQAPGQWKRLAKRFRWSERAAAWDDYQDQVKLEGQLAAIEEMCKRHAQIAMVSQAKLIERLQTFEASELTPKDMITWLEASVKVERLARGEPSEIQRQKHEPLEVAEVLVHTREEAQELLKLLKLT